MAGDNCWEEGHVSLLRFAVEDVEPRFYSGEVHRMRIRRDSSPIRLSENEVMRRKEKTMYKGVRYEICVEALSAAWRAERETHERTRRGLGEMKKAMLATKARLEMWYQTLNISALERMPARQVATLTGLPGLLPFKVSTHDIRLSDE